MKANSNRFGSTISETPRHLRILSEPRCTHRPAFHGHARCRIVVARGDTQTPVIPIRWLGSFDVHRTWPTYRPSSTYAHHILGSCLVSFRVWATSRKLQRSSKIQLF